VLAFAVILSVLPERFQVLPRGAALVIALVMAGSMLAAGFAPTNMRLIHLEHYISMIVLPLATVAQLVTLGVLIVVMSKKHSDISGIKLLSTSIGIWATNIIVFSLAYWQLDRGGPSGRAMGFKGRADFTFPLGNPSDNVPADWQPAFFDYLSLAFNTATAFSPTDVLPLTERAKILMGMEAFISLVTVVAVGARAINILGS
jgi:hypothetical protein